MSEYRALLKDIGKILNYHASEFRVLSGPAQQDIAAIRDGIRDATAPRASNGVDGLPQPAKRKTARKKAKSKVKAKAKDK